MRPPVLQPATATTTVWRVGFGPEPWAWPGWQFAPNGRFDGRWDDRDGNFRTIYAGDNLLACLLEVLAGFRVDHDLVADLEAISEDPHDAIAHPTIPPGEVPLTWLEPRMAASAELNGTFCAVTATESIAALHPHFVALAHSMSLHDFDAAALKDARPRKLTQSVATFLYETTDFAGVTFESRHGDDLLLWAVFERDSGANVSPLLVGIRQESMRPDHPALIEAFRLLGLRWAYL